MTPAPEQEPRMVNGARELWQPSRSDQMAALEILLASSIPTELRCALRDLEQQIVTRKEMQ